jgi:CheY-like chemotaxis protein
MLNSLDQEVIVARNGKEAVEMVNSDIDLVFMDVRMPVMDGVEATKYIRSLPGYESLPIMALTANAADEDREKYLQSGISALKADSMIF